jgi:tRNA(fMet)-specific endonuclease VapC
VARYLIDTDVMVDVSRRNAAAAAYIDSLDDLSISIITAHELIVGARNQRDAEAIDSLIQTFPVQSDLEARITELAYQLLKRHAKADGLRTFDALIAATAIDGDFTLVSRNRKHFEMLSGLNLEVPQILSCGVHETRSYYPV